MNFIEIDIETWNRAKAYSHYMTEVPCTYSMCVNIDIRKLMRCIGEHKLKLFPSCLYGIALIVNRHQEFRMALNTQGKLGYFSVTNPCYTVFHKEIEMFSDVWTEYSEDFDTFYQNYILSHHTKKQKVAKLRGK